MNTWTRLTLLCVAGLLFVAGAYLTNRERAKHLEAELYKTRSELEQLHVDHRDTMDAITSALDAREAIHEQAKLRENKLQKALEDDPLSSMPLSDALRMCIQWDAASGICEVPSSGGAAGRHHDSGSFKCQDGW